MGRSPNVTVVHFSEPSRLPSVLAKVMERLVQGSITRKQMLDELDAISLKRAAAKK
jgi:hypothetical protein